MCILLVDNFDSYTYNLMHLIGRISGAYPLVMRNDHPDLSVDYARQFSAVVLSPGPGTPLVAQDVGCMPVLIQQLIDTPILGVCLGMQCIAHVFNAHIIRHPRPAHGRCGQIYHKQEGLFSGIPQGFHAMRYHSFCVDPHTLPDCLEATAWLPDHTIMALQHRQRPLFGVQFHPESVLSVYGQQLIMRFLQQANDVDIATQTSHNKTVYAQSTDKQSTDKQSTAQRHWPAYWSQFGTVASVAACCIGLILGLCSDGRMDLWKQRPTHPR